MKNGSAEGYDNNPAELSKYLGKGKQRLFEIFHEKYTPRRMTWIFPGINCYSDREEKLITRICWLHNNDFGHTCIQYCTEEYKSYHPL